MSPVLLADGKPALAPASRAGRRRGPRWTLLLIPLGMLLPAPLVPLFHPVKARINGRVFIIGTTTLSSGERNGPPRQGFEASSRSRGSATEDLEHVQYRIQGPLHLYSLRVADWVYYLAWFRGRRAS